MELHLSYERTESGGQPLSNEKWSDRSPTVITFTPQSIHLERDDVPSWRNETIKCAFEEAKRGDNVFVVIVRYRDGDTFGYSTGNYSFWGVYKDVERAHKLKKLIQEDARHGDSYKQDAKDREKVIKSLASSDYVSLYDWRGYFNGLESVEIHPMVVV